MSDDSGTANTTLTFAAGTNPDIAQVQVQNKLQLATPLLPATGTASRHPGHPIEQQLSAGRGLRVQRQQHVALRHRQLCRFALAGSTEPGQRRGQLQRLRYPVRDAHLARCRQAQQLRVDAGRRRERDPEPERPGCRRPARRNAGAADTAADRDDHRGDAAAHADGVRQHPAEGQPRRVPGAHSRRRARRAWRRDLLHRLALQRPAGVGDRHPAGAGRQRARHGQRW